MEIKIRSKRESTTYVKGASVIGACRVCQDLLDVLDEAECEEERDIPTERAYAEHLNRHHGMSI